MNGSSASKVGFRVAQSI